MKDAPQGAEDQHNVEEMSTEHEQKDVKIANADSIGASKTAASDLSGKNKKLKAGSSGSKERSTDKKKPGVSQNRLLKKLVDRKQLGKITK